MLIYAWEDGQEFGLTKIIPWIFTSVIWGQYPVFLHPEFPQGSPLGVDASDGCQIAGILLLSDFPQGSPAHLDD